MYVMKLETNRALTPGYSAVSRWEPNVRWIIVAEVHTLNTACMHQGCTEGEDCAIHYK